MSKFPFEISVFLEYLKWFECPKIFFTAIYFYNTIIPIVTLEIMI